jgi:hypothetical protein
METYLFRTIEQINTIALHENMQNENCKWARRKKLELDTRGIVTTNVSKISEGEKKQWIHAS